MHISPAIIAIAGLVLLASACSSELDDAKTLRLGTNGTDAAFSYYDMDQDMAVTASEIYQREKTCGATAITSQQSADEVLSEYDFDDSAHLDNLEFTGLVQPRTLACALNHPEWTTARP